MKNIPLWHRATALLLVFTLLAGCAVVTVDVDVYKGPLANTEEIQGEQVVSLVMGAKPLLVQLRDHLEASEPRVVHLPHSPAAWQRPSGQELEERLRDLRSSPGYEAGYMVPVFGQEQSQSGHRFTNELALRVNDVLGLYEDRVEKSISAAVREAREWLHSYRLSYDRLEPNDNRETKRIWDREFFPLLREHTNQTLVKAYGEFLLHKQGNLPPTNYAFRSETALFPPSGSSSNSQTTSRFAPEFKAQYTSFNYQILKDSVVRGHAQQLFGNDRTNSAVRERFEKEVTEICDAFLESRRDLRGLLRLGLFNLSQLKSISSLRPAVRSELAEELARASAQLINASAVQLAISNSRPGSALSQLTNIFKPSGAAAAAKDENGRKQLEFRFGLNEPLQFSLDQMQMDAWRTNLVVDKRRWRTALANALLHETESLKPGQLALELLAADQQMAEKGKQEIQPSPTSFVFGLAINPEQFSRDFDEAPTPENLFGKTLNLIAKQSGPLDGGRLPEGMETLIEQYLAAAKVSRDFANRITLDEGDRLLAGLTQFGEKAVSLGNLAPLISTVSGNGVKRYISVLQGVGNSVLVHVDELKQSARHEEQLKKRSGLVAAALFNQVGTNLTNSSALNVDSWQSNQFNAREAAEQLVTELRAEYIRLLRESKAPPDAGTRLTLDTSVSVTNASATLTTVLPGRTNTVAIDLQGTSDGTNPNSRTVAVPGSSDGLARYREALERAIEIRAGLIHLRPASSYLRSSYPASTLRRSTLTTGNMLSQQAMRQIPLIGGLADGYNNQDLKTFLELDQQSWQNVNKVRVAGAGDVNYAIAKDDVGNWYVKAYETDPGRIFKSMRNVAAFSLGGTFGQQLPIRSSSTDEVLASTNGALQRQITTAMSNYRMSTTNEFGRLLGGLDGLKGNLPGRWSKADLSVNLATATNAFKRVWDDTENRVKQARTTWDNAIADKKAVAALAEIAETEIPALLEWGTDLHRKTAAAITLAEFKKDDGTSPSTDPEKKIVQEQKIRAVSELSKGVGELLKASVNSRNQAFDSLQVSLRVIKTGAESD